MSRAALAIDTIKTAAGKSLAGHVAGMDRVNVELEQGASATVKEVPANQIVMIYYEGEPSALHIAKEHLLAGRYADALTALGRIKEEASRPEIQQDVEFYRALATAKLALGGTGEIKIVNAGHLMNAFADANPKSYHYFEASEIVGDLLVANRSYAAAAEYYARLEKAPWPDYKMLSGVASGRALLDNRSPPRPWPSSTRCWPTTPKAMPRGSNAWPPPSARPPHWSRSKNPTRP